MANISLQGEVTLAKLYDGIDSLSIVLDNESQQIPTDWEGNKGNYSAAKTKVMIFQGTKEVTAQWNITATPSSGLTGSLTGNTYTVTNLTKDSGTVNFLATNIADSSLTLSKTFTITKSKQGDPNTIYNLNIDTPTIKKYEDVLVDGSIIKGFSYNPTALKANLSVTTGDSIGSADGYFKVFVQRPGITTKLSTIKLTDTLTAFNEEYASGLPESNISFELTGDIHAVKIEVYKDAGFTEILDTQTVHAISDGKANIAVISSNDVISLSGNYKGEVTDFSTASGKFIVYEGIEDVTSLCTFSLKEATRGIECSIVSSTGAFSVTSIDKNLDNGVMIFDVTYKNKKYTKTINVNKTNDGKDGSDAQFLFLSTDKDYFSYDKEGNPKPAGQVINVKARLQNIIGNADFVVEGFKDNVTKETIVVTPTDNNLELTNELVKSYSYIKVSASIQGRNGVLSDTTTISKVTDGSEAIATWLTNENVTLSSTETGVITSGGYATATGYFKVFQGSKDVSSLSTFRTSTSEDYTISINTEGKYNLTYIKPTIDNVSVDITARYKGNDYTKVFTVSKSKVGKQGESAQLLALSSNKDYFSYDKEGNLKPLNQEISIKALLQNVTGNVTFSVTGLKPDGTSEPVTVTPSANTIIITKSIISNYTQLTVVATIVGKNNTVLTDTKTISKVYDGTETLLGMLTNESITLPANSTGIVDSTSYATATGKFIVMYGSKDVTSESTFNYTADSTKYTMEIKSDGTYKILSINNKVDNVTIPLSATYKGKTVNKVLSIAKSKAGNDGASGSSSYVWVMYAKDENGLDAVITIPNGSESLYKYIGIAITRTPEQPLSNTGLYKWTKYVGKDGIGQDGKSIHIKYSNDGGKTFTANNGETMGSFIGIYVDTNIKDSNDPFDYTWNRIAGIDGSNGKDAVTAILSNDSYNINCDYQGAPLSGALENATTTMSIYVGATKLTNLAGWTFTPRLISGTATFTASANTLRITGLTTDSAKIEFTASNATIGNYSKEFNITKTKNGAKGDSGENAKILVLSSSSYVLGFTADNQPKPESQYTELEAKLQNTGGDIVFTTKAYLGNVEQTDANIELNGTGNKRTLNSAQLMNYDKLVVTATLGKLTDSVTIVKAVDGNNGRDSYVHTMYSNNISFGDYDYSGNPNLMNNISSDNWSKWITDYSEPNPYVKLHDDYIVIDANDSSANEVGRNIYIPNIARLEKGKRYTMSVSMMVDEEFDSGGENSYGQSAIHYVVQSNGKPERTNIIRPKSSMVNKWERVSVSFTMPTNISDGEYIFLHVYENKTVTGKWYIKNDIKIEEGNDSTPYQPNLLLPPYEISKYALEKNIANPDVVFPIKTTSYSIYDASIQGKWEVGQEYTLTLKGKKPSSQIWAPYINGGTINKPSLAPVKGLPDIYSVSFKVTQEDIDKGANRTLQLYQYPSSSTGDITIEWLKLEKSSNRTPNIESYDYIGFYTGNSNVAPNNPTLYKWNNFRGNDGKDPITHYGYSWSADGTDRFTPVYPGENYVLKSKEPYTATGNGGSNQYPESIKNIPFNPDILGKQATIQYKLTISNYVSGDTVDLKMYQAVGVWSSHGNWTGITGNGTKLVQWKGTLRPLKEGGIPKIDFFTNLKADIKIEELRINEGTEYKIYTPAPSEDYENAYPTFIGMYTDYNLEGSDKPSDYIPWNPIRGASSLNLVLTNESVTLPSSSTGVVSSYENSVTDIMVYEGSNLLNYDGVGEVYGSYTVKMTANGIEGVKLIKSGNSVKTSQATNMPNDYASIKFEVSGYRTTGVPFSISSTQTFSKSKSGYDAVIQNIELNSSVIYQNLTGVLTPNPVIAKVKQIVGKNQPTYIRAKFKVQGFNANGTKIEDTPISALTESFSYNITNKEIKSINVIAYQDNGTTIIDNQSLYIVKDGLNSFNVSINSSNGNLFVFDGDNKSIGITKTVLSANINGDFTPTKYAWTKNGAAAGSNGSIEVTNTEMSKISNMAIGLTVTGKNNEKETTLTATTNIVSTKNGSESYLIMLSRELSTFPTNDKGVLLDALTNNTTNVSLYKGSTQLTPVISKTTPVGCKVTASGNTVTINSLSDNIDSGYVDIEVSYGGSIIGTKRYSFSKVRQGQSMKLYTAYADNFDGTKGFSLTDSNKPYFGQYTSFEDTQSMDPSRYKWTIIGYTDELAYKTSDMNPVLTGVDRGGFITNLEGNSRDSRFVDNNIIKKISRRSLKGRAIVIDLSEKIKNGIYHFKTSIRATISGEYFAYMEDIDGNKISDNYILYLEKDFNNVNIKMNITGITKSKYARIIIRNSYDIDKGVGIPYIEEGQSNMIHYGYSINPSSGSFYKFPPLENIVDDSNFEHPENWRNYLDGARYFIDPESDKPNSRILSLQSTTESSTWLASAKTYRVRKGNFVHISFDVKIPSIVQGSDQGIFIYRVVRDPYPNPRSNSNILTESQLKQTAHFSLGPNDSNKWVRVKSNNIQVSVDGWLMPLFVWTVLDGTSIIKYRNLKISISEERLDDNKIEIDYHPEASTRSPQAMMPYIGKYLDTTSENSSDINKYKWVEYKDENGFTIPEIHVVDSQLYIDGAIQLPNKRNRNEIFNIGDTNGYVSVVFANSKTEFPYNLVDGVPFTTNSIGDGTSAPWTFYKTDSGASYTIDDRIVTLTGTDKSKYSQFSLRAQDQASSRFSKLEYGKTYVLGLNIDLSGMMDGKFSILLQNKYSGNSNIDYFAKMEFNPEGKRGLNEANMEFTINDNTLADDISKLIETRFMIIGQFVGTVKFSDPYIYEKSSDSIRNPEDKLIRLYSNSPDGSKDLILEEDLNTVNDKLTQSEIYYTNDNNFGNYDYSGNPNLMPYITDSWVGSLLANGDTVKDSVKRIITHTKTKTADGGDILSLGLGIPRSVEANNRYLITYLRPSTPYTLTVTMSIGSDWTGETNTIGVRVRYLNESGDTELPINVLLPANVERDKMIAHTFTGVTKADLSGMKNCYIQIFSVNSEDKGTVSVSYDVKLEIGTIATPYQPNLLDKPYYLSKVPLGKNLVTNKQFPIRTLNNPISEFDILEEPVIGETYTVSLKGFKPANKEFQLYYGDSDNFQVTLNPVEGLLDVWSATFKARNATGMSNLLRVALWQMPTTVTNGPVQIDWFKIEKGDTRTPNIDSYNYSGSTSYPIKWKNDKNYLRDYNFLQGDIRTWRSWGGLLMGKGKNFIDERNNKLLVEITSGLYLTIGTPEQEGFGFAQDFVDNIVFKSGDIIEFSANLRILGNAPYANVRLRMGTSNGGYQVLDNIITDNEIHELRFRGTVLSSDGTVTVFIGLTTPLNLAPGNVRLEVYETSLRKIENEEIPLMDKGAYAIKGMDKNEGMFTEFDKDDKEVYSHVAYSNSPNGKLDFTLKPDPFKKYSHIGFYVSNDNSSSLNYLDYQWQAIDESFDLGYLKGKNFKDQTPYLNLAWVDDLTENEKTLFQTQLDLYNFAKSINFGSAYNLFKSGKNSYRIKGVASNRNEYLYNNFTLKAGVTYKVGIRYKLLKGNTPIFFDLSNTSGELNPTSNAVRLTKSNNYQYAEVSFTPTGNNLAIYLRFNASTTADEIELLVDSLNITIDQEIATRYPNLNLLNSSKGPFTLVPKNAGIDSDNYNYYRFDADMKMNETYTFSAKIKVTNGNFNNVSLYPYPGGTLSNSTIGKNGEVSLTFTKKSEQTVSVLVYAGSSGSTRGNGIEITDVKLEKSNSKTIYTQSPKSNYTKAHLEYIGTSLTYGSAMSDSDKTFNKFIWRKSKCNYTGSLFLTDPLKEASFREIRSLPRPNLLKNSGYGAIDPLKLTFVNTVKPYTGYHDLYFNGKREMHTLRNSTTVECMTYSNYFNVEYGKKYTFSGLFIANEYVKNMDIYFLGNDGRSTTLTWDEVNLFFTNSIETEKLVLLKGTFTPKNSTTKGGWIRVDLNSTTVEGKLAVLYFTNLKVEEGTVYSPHRLHESEDPDLQSIEYGQVVVLDTANNNEKNLIKPNSEISLIGSRNSGLPVPTYIDETYLNRKVKIAYANSPDGVYGFSKNTLNRNIFKDYDLKISVYTAPGETSSYSLPDGFERVDIETMKKAVELYTNQSGEITRVSIKSGKLYTMSLTIRTDALIKDINSLYISWFGLQNTGGVLEKKPIIIDYRNGIYRIYSTITADRDRILRSFDITAIKSAFDFSNATYFDIGDFKIENGEYSAYTPPLYSNRNQTPLYEGYYFSRKGEDSDNPSDYIWRKVENITYGERDNILYRHEALSSLSPEVNIKDDISQSSVPSEVLVYPNVPEINYLEASSLTKLETSNIDEEGKRFTRLSLDNLRDQSMIGGKFVTDIDTIIEENQNYQVQMMIRSSHTLNNVNLVARSILEDTDNVIDENDIYYGVNILAKTNTDDIAGGARENQIAYTSNFIRNISPAIELKDLDIRDGDDLKLRLKYKISGSGFAGNFRFQTASSAYLPFHIVNSDNSIGGTIVDITKAGEFSYEGKIVNVEYSKIGGVNNIQLRLDNIPTTVKIKIIDISLEIDRKEIKNPYRIESLNKDEWQKITFKSEKSRGKIKKVQFGIDLNFLDSTSQRSMPENLNIDFCGITVIKGNMNNGKSTLEYNNAISVGKFISTDSNISNKSKDYIWESSYIPNEDKFYPMIDEYLANKSNYSWFTKNTIPNSTKRIYTSVANPSVLSQRNRLLKSRENWKLIKDLKDSYEIIRINENESNKKVIFRQYMSSSIDSLIDSKVALSFINGGNNIIKTVFGNEIKCGDVGLSEVVSDIPANTKYIIAYYAYGYNKLGSVRVKESILTFTNDPFNDNILWSPHISNLNWINQRNVNGNDLNDSGEILLGNDFLLNLPVSRKLGKGITQPNKFNLLPYIGYSITKSKYDVGSIANYKFFNSSDLSKVTGITLRYADDNKGRNMSNSFSDTTKFIGIKSSNVSLDTDPNSYTWISLDSDRIGSIINDKSTKLRLLSSRNKLENIDIIRNKDLYKYGLGSTVNDITQINDSNGNTKVHIILNDNLDNILPEATMTGTPSNYLSGDYSKFIVKSAYLGSHSEVIFELDKSLFSNSTYFHFESSISTDNSSLSIMHASNKADIIISLRATNSNGETFNSKKLFIRGRDLTLESRKFILEDILYLDTDITSVKLVISITSSSGNIIFENNSLIPSANLVPKFNGGQWNINSDTNSGEIIPINSFQTIISNENIGTNKTSLYTQSISGAGRLSNISTPGEYVFDVGINPIHLEGDNGNISISTKSKVANSKNDFVGKVIESIDLNEIEKGNSINENLVVNTDFRKGWGTTWTSGDGGTREVTNDGIKITAIGNNQYGVGDSITKKFKAGDKIIVSLICRGAGFIQPYFLMASGLNIQIGARLATPEFKKHEFKFTYPSRTEDIKSLSILTIDPSKYLEIKKNSVKLEIDNGQSTPWIPNKQDLSYSRSEISRECKKFEMPDKLDLIPISNTIFEISMSKAKGKILIDQPIISLRRNRSLLYSNIEFELDDVSQSFNYIAISFDFSSDITGPVEFVPEDELIGAPIVTKNSNRVILRGKLNRVLERITPIKIAIKYMDGSYIDISNYSIRLFETEDELMKEVQSNFLDSYPSSTDSNDSDKYWIEPVIDTTIDSVGLETSDVLNRKDNGNWVVTKKTNRLTPDIQNLSIKYDQEIKEFVLNYQMQKSSLSPSTEPLINEDRVLNSMGLKTNITEDNDFYHIGSILDIETFLVEDITKYKDISLTADPDVISNWTKDNIIAEDKYRNSEVYKLDNFYKTGNMLNSTRLTNNTAYIIVFYASSIGKSVLEINIGGTGVSEGITSNGETNQGNQFNVSVEGSSMKPYVVKFISGPTELTGNIQLVMRSCNSLSISKMFVFNEKDLINRVINSNGGMEYVYPIKEATEVSINADNSHKLVSLRTYANRNYFGLMSRNGIKGKLYGKLTGSQWYTENLYKMEIQNLYDEITNISNNIVPSMEDGILSASEFNYLKYQLNEIQREHDQFTSKYVNINENYIDSDLYSNIIDSHDQYEESYMALVQTINDILALENSEEENLYDLIKSLKSPLESALVDYTSKLSIYADYLDKYIKFSIDNAMDQISTIYTKKTELEQTKEAILAAITQSGGSNLINDSIGWAYSTKNDLNNGYDPENNPDAVKPVEYWKDGEDITTIQNAELEDLGFGSGWFKTKGSNTHLNQLVRLPSTGTYTLSAYFNMPSAGGPAYIQLLDPDTNEPLEVISPTITTNYFDSSKEIMPEFVSNNNNVSGWEINGLEPGVEYTISTNYKLRAGSNADIFILASKTEAIDSSYNGTYLGKTITKASSPDGKLYIVIRSKSSGSGLSTSDIVSGAYWINLEKGKASSSGMVGMPYGRVTSGFEYFVGSFRTNKLSVLVKLITETNSEFTLSGLMMNIGSVPFTWSPGAKEVYNTNVRFDINGVRVYNNGKTGNYTQMTPNEFAGYYNRERIFTLNGEKTIVRSLKASKTIEMGPIRIVEINSDSYKGWAFIPNVE